MKIVLILLTFLTLSISCMSQVGINTTAPDSSAILDLSSTNKGLLIPTMTTSNRESMAMSPPATGLADGLLVFDVELFCFYYWDSSAGKWVAINPWRREHEVDPADTMHVTTTLNTVSNVGIGVVTPSSKLTVDGNLSVGNPAITAPADGIYTDGRLRVGSSSGNSEIFEVGGDATITDTTTSDIFVGRGITPVGGIIMFSGSTAGLFNGTGLGEGGTRMEGWAICNGNNGTPDLRDKFVVGAGSTYTVTDEGGEDLHILSESEMPNHNHSGSTNTTGDHRHYIVNSGSAGSTTPSSSNYVYQHTDEGNYEEYQLRAGGSESNRGLTSNQGNHSHTITIGNTGNGNAHENRPPYYAVYYIMRIN